MTESQITQLRLALLLQMDAQDPAPIAETTLHQGALLAGFSGVSAQDIQSHIKSLVQLGLVDEQPNPLNAALKRYTRTEAGRVALVQAGLKA